MQVVVKLGGSLFYNDAGEILVDKFRSYADIIGGVSKEHKLVVIVGGGKPARTFIAAARELGASESDCDWLGIELARHNAELLRTALGKKAYPRIAESLDELALADCQNRIILMGGLTPGQSTNAVAALAAETVGADMMLNATDVDGVYNKDPDESDAKKLDSVHIDELKKILSGGAVRAGEYRLFDPVALKVVERSKIKTIFFDGRNPKNLEAILAGKEIGTVVTHEEN
ncbi:UMP kinase [Candidatus Thorarchaeota archaeon]|nr:MAG: UMP kinase [Candidatus Thorarchaeota archaeon]